MYPPGHPSLRPAAGDVLDRLSALFVGRGEVRIGILRHGFLCEGGETRPDRPVFAELALRLHEHDLAALTFRLGVELHEISLLLSSLAGDISRGAPSTGGLAREAESSFVHIAVEPLSYEELALAAPGSGTTVTRIADLWKSLVRSTLGEDADGTSEETPARMAHAIRERVDDPLHVRIVSGYLAPLVEALAEEADSHSATGVRAGVSDLIQRLDGTALERLLAGGGDPEWRRQLLGSASRSLELGALLDLLDAAATTSDTDISTSMTRLLTKLAAQAGAGRTRRELHAAEAVRDNVRSIVRDWHLDDPNPEGYSNVLDAMVRGSGRHGRSDDDGHEHTVDIARRILTITVEADTWGSAADRAVLRLLDAGELAWVLDLLEDAAGTRAAQSITAHLCAPRMVRRAVSGEQIDAASLRRLAALAGPSAIPALMDGLVAARDRDHRRAIFDTLARFGDDLIPEITARLGGPYWYVTRNLLNLLALIPGRADIDVMEFMSDEDARVRRAALPVALRDVSIRETALHMALADRDERVVQHAVVQARNEPSPELLQAVLDRVVLARRSPELRSLAIHTVRGRRSPQVREALMAVATGQGSEEGTDLAETGPVVAALEALRAEWSAAADVRAVLARARESRDPVIRSAAGGL